MAPIELALLMFIRRIPSSQKIVRTPRIKNPLIASSSQACFMIWRVGTNSKKLAKIIRKVPAITLLINIKKLGETS